MPDLTSYNLCNAWEKLEAERIEGVYTSANPPDAGGSHQTLQRTQSAGARRTGHLLARKTPAHGRRPQTHPLGRTGRQPQAAGDDRLLVQQRGGRDEGFGAHGALGRRERFVPQEKLPVPQHIERQQHQERQFAVGRFRGLRPDESLLERRRSPDGPDRPLGPTTKWPTRCTTPRSERSTARPTPA